MTNGDRIRQMSNEELVELLDGNCHWCEYGVYDRNCRDLDCRKGIKAYLDMEVEE